MKRLINKYLAKYCGCIGLGFYIYHRRTITLANGDKIKKMTAKLQLLYWGIEIDFYLQPTYDKQNISR